MKTFSLLAFMLVSGLVSSAVAKVFVIVPASTADSVLFRSTASLEFIEGKTTDLAGWINWEPAEPNLPVSGMLRVDLRTLRTGIETRDEHMRDRHLHTEKYPYAWFSLTGLTGLPAKVVPDSSYHAVAQGYFYIHGVRRRLEAEVDFALSGADSALSARVTFVLTLDDYKISRPKALFLKLAETIEVEVVLTARPAADQPELSLPDWPELK